MMVCYLNLKKKRTKKHYISYIINVALEQD